MSSFSSFKSMYFKIGFFLLLLFSISIGIYYILSSTLLEKENTSHMINVAGRERLLAERMNKIAIQIAFMESDESRTELQQAIQEFEQGLHSIQNGREHLQLINNNEEIRNQFNHSKAIWSDLKENYTELILTPDTASQKIILTNINAESKEEIASLDVLVSIIEEEGQENFQGLNAEKIILIFINLLLIIVLFVIWRLFTNIKNSERKYRMLIEHSPMGIVTLKDNKISFINKVGIQTFGALSSDEMVGKSIFNFIKPNIKAEIKIDELMEERCNRIDGSEVDLEIVLIPVNLLGEKCEMVLFKDITEKVQSINKAENIYNELTNIRSALDVSSIVEVVDRSGKLLYVNDKFCNLAKYKPEEVIGKTHRVLQSGHHSKEFYKNMWTTIIRGQVWEGQIKNKAKDGSYYWAQTIIVPFINSKGEPYQFLTIRNDITARKEAENEIRLLATHDHLTQLSNRRTFEYELQQAIDRRESVAVVFIDLDRFKYINDTLGHNIGDRLIKSVARRLKEVVDSDAVVSRQGGDEFTILVKYNGREAIERLTEEMIERIKQPYVIEQKEILITCSVGISIYPEHGHDMETLMKNADVAMYWSKDKGKDDYSFYEPHMKEKSARIMELELELRKAVENEEFILYYQPKINLKTEEIVGCEALIRWNHPKMGMISPAEFIPLAEETGLINPIGEWALREACVQNKKWHDEGYSEFIMAVNMSAYQFKQPNMVAMIERILHETQLEAQFLEIEITESISMLTEEVIMKQLYSLKAIGVSIAIDDFGTGYSSLKYLDLLPADVIKIDKSFIDEIGSRNRFTSSMMTNAIISLAKSLKMKVVAEGIEEIDQLRYLRQYQCDCGQGYLFSKPLPAYELESKFMRDNEKVYFAV